MTDRRMNVAKKCMIVPKRKMNDHKKGWHIHEQIGTDRYKKGTLILKLMSVPVFKSSVS
jgi:hypothetical protein